MGAISTQTHVHEYLIWEDELPSPFMQSHTLKHLEEVLSWLYHAQGWLSVPDLACYHPAIRNSQQLYDRTGARRLTQAEAETQARQQAEAQAQAEAETALLRRLLLERGIEPPSI